MKKTSDLLHINILVKLLAILFIALSFISCSSNDDDSSLNTFLETFNETKWKYEQNGNIYYYRFKNNILQPFDYWFESNEDFLDCYYYWLTSNDPFEIIENSNDSFKIVFDYGSTTETFIFSKSGESLNLTNIVDDEGNINSSNHVLNDTSDNVDGLVICD